MDKKHIVFKVITILLVVITLILAVYIIINQLGLVKGYDFGAGAYYYADIPADQYDEIVNEDAYETSVPHWVFYVLFWHSLRLYVCNAVYV